MDWYENIKKWYSMGLWNEEMVDNAVSKNKITKEEADTILNSNKSVEKEE